MVIGQKEKHNIFKMPVDWENLFKVRLAQADPSMDKHDIVKTLLVRKILFKNRSRKDWIRIYTEFELENGLRPDIYFEDSKTKEIIVYEIQKQFTKTWIGDKAKQYSEFKKIYFKPVDLIVIPLKELSNDIEEMSKQLEEYIV